jgi:hypothetical protein
MLEKVIWVSIRLFKETPEVAGPLGGEVKMSGEIRPNYRPSAGDSTPSQEKGLLLLPCCYQERAMAIEPSPRPYCQRHRIQKNGVVVVHHGQIGELEERGVACYDLLPGQHDRHGEE